MENVLLIAISITIMYLLISFIISRWEYILETFFRADAVLEAFELIIKGVIKSLF